MRKPSWILAAAAAALAVTGVAFAHGFGGKAAQAVGATFTATQVTASKTWTCTNAAGTWSRTTATYTGSASGDADLAGPVRLRVTSVIDGSHDAGVVDGALRIDTAAGRDTVARFTGAYQGGKVAGLLVGKAHDPGARLVANVSASFSATGGFTNGKIGSSDGGAAVEVVDGKCKATPPPRPVVRMDGQVTAASSTSLTVQHGKQQLAMSVPSSLASAAGALHTGDHVQVVAARIDGNYVLVSLKTKTH